MEIPTKVIVNHLTYDWTAQYNVRPWKQSLTVPDMVMPLEEVIRRFTRGLAVPTLPTYDIDGDFSGYDNLDVFQRIDLQRKLEARKAVLRSEIDNKRAESKKKSEKERFDALVKEHVQKLRDEETKVSV